MPYQLINAGFRTQPDDPTFFGTLVRLEDEGEEGECIALESDGDTIYIDIDEWPLVVKAVDKLLQIAPRAAFDEAVTERFLEQIGFHPVATKSVLHGRKEDLDDAFTWSRTPQGFQHWRSICKGDVPLTKADKKVLQSWVDAYYYYARKNND